MCLKVKITFNKTNLECTYGDLCLGPHLISAFFLKTLIHCILPLNLSIFNVRFSVITCIECVYTQMCMFRSPGEIRPDSQCHCVCKELGTVLCGQFVVLVFV